MENRVKDKKTEDFKSKEKNSQLLVTEKSTKQDSALAPDSLSEARETEASRPHTQQEDFLSLKLQRMCPSE